MTTPQGSSSNNSFGHQFHLLICVIGIYATFLTWGVLQERLSTQDYPSVTGSKQTKHRFDSFLVLNLVQAALAALVAFIHVSLTTGLGPMKADILLGFAKGSFASCIASPFGYASIKYLSFPTVVLGKSCKLVPVLLMNVVIHRRSYHWSKYLTVLLVTVGVAGFMLFAEQKQAAKHAVATSSLLGLGLLAMNLFLDGVVNTTQENIVRRYRIHSPQLMFWTNLFSVLFLALYLVVPTFHFHEWQLGGRDDWDRAVRFIASHPLVLQDMILFGICGALGQTVLFHTLAHFGAILLVTVTVTRKLVTILLSLFWFQHPMAPLQWFCVVLAFIGIGVEAFGPRDQKHTHHAPVVEATATAPSADDANIVSEEEEEEMKPRRRSTRRSVLARAARLGAIGGDGGTPMRSSASEDDSPSSVTRLRTKTKSTTNSPLRRSSRHSVTRK